jgi:hypothetical protein
MVGSFPGMNDFRRRTIRAPVNPLDKSTVVSLLPKLIQERKATVQPGEFTIQPGTPEKPSILVVGPSSWWREVDESQPLLEIPVSSIQIADSIVRDYIVGLIECDMNESRPGLFYIPGVVTVPEILTKYKALVEQYTQYQKNWFLKLIKEADVLWSRTSHNPLSVPDDARLACKMLNIQNKEWLGEYKEVDLVRCIACGGLRNPEFPICPACKAIVDPELAKKLNLTFAQ